MIQISAQYDSPKATAVVRPLHREANEAFEKVVVNTYLKTVEKLSIVLRVSGSVWKFEEEGPTHLKYLKKHREITVDLEIPERRWQDMEPAEFREYFGKQLAKCFDALVARANREGEVIDEANLRNDIDRVLQEFLNR